MFRATKIYPQYCWLQSSYWQDILHGNIRITLEIVFLRYLAQDTSKKAYLSSWDGVRMDVMDPSKIAQIKAADSFIPAVNIPAYDIGVLDNDLKITFPGSDYAGTNNFL